MSVEQTIIESNQEFIEKVIKENENLLSQISSLKKEISQMKININKLHLDVIKTVEPKINQLIKKHNDELEKQKALYIPKINQNQIKCKKENESIKLQCENEIKEAENKKKSKIEKMKITAANRKNELKCAIEEKSKLIPSKIEKAKQKVLNEEELFRQQWEKIIYEKLKKEFQEVFNNEHKTLKNQQEQKIIEVVNQVELSTHDDAKIFESKIDRESKQHQIAFKKLKQRICDLSDELNSLETSKNLQNDDELFQLKEKISKCQCAKYREQIRKLNIEIAEHEETLKDIQKRKELQKIQIDSDSASFRSNYQKEIKNKENLLSEINNLEKELIITQNKTSKEINDLEEQHKQQISLIGERIKQTVSKKDKVILELKEKLSKFGFL